MRTKSCVIFSCTILSNDRIGVLISYINALTERFLDSDIYVGINYNSVPLVEHLLNNSTLNIKSMVRASKELYTESDASAYQIALDSLRCRNVEYDTYWFIHTKGAVNSHSDYLSKWYIDNLLLKRPNIEDILVNNKHIGSYGLLGLEYDSNRVYLEKDTEIPLFSNGISDHFPYTHCNFFYLHSMYVINSGPIKKFFASVTDTWFKSKLDRYYFEGIFPFIVSKSGYYPYIENGISCTGVDLSTCLQKWVNDNNLYYYNNLIHRFKYKTPFNQLYPPPCY